MIAHVANLGDTRAILITSNGAERITVDHKATDPSEIKRIQYS
jgi:serine/threonine protein phosphatase PrpC